MDQSKTSLQLTAVVGLFDVGQTKLEHPNFVPVFSGSEKIGWASLERRNNPTKGVVELRAHMNLLLQTPEAFSIENKVEDLFAVPKGLAAHPDASFMVPLEQFDHSTGTPDEVYVDGIALERRPFFRAQPSLLEPLL